MSWRGDDMNMERKVMNWSEFVAVVEKYPKHLFGTCQDPDCHGRLLSIPTGDYYEIERQILTPGDKICLDCRGIVKNKPIIHTNIYVIKTDQKGADIIIKRQRFNEEYCKKKGWDINNLDWKQIMEIREQKEWKNSK